VKRYWLVYSHFVCFVLTMCAYKVLIYNYATSNRVIILTIVHNLVIYSKSLT
jgi:hypothetical protein